MGTGGRGNIVHIDNLYVKTFNVQDDVNIVLGDYIVIEATGARPLLTSDFGGNDMFLTLNLINLVQAGEDANNLNTTDALLRKNQIECITKGSDWTLNMRAGVLPDNPVGILRVDGADEIFQAASETVGTTSVSGSERIGIYKHKEFSTVASVAVQDDNGIISTGGLA